MTSEKLGTAELLYRRAKQMSLQPSWVIQDGLFTIQTTSGEKYINFARSPFNSDVSISLAKNKYVTRLLMERHQLPNIPFARPQNLVEAKQFLKKHAQIIVKPVTGYGAQDIHIVSDGRELETMNIRKYIFEKYIAGKEMRYLVLNNDIIGVHESKYGTSVAEDRPLQRISYQHTTWDPLLIALSLRIANILDLHFAAVDYLIDAQGQVYILEVNTNPGLKWFHAPTSGPPVDVAGIFITAILEGLHKPMNLHTDRLGIPLIKVYS